MNSNDNKINFDANEEIVIKMMAVKVRNNFNFDYTFLINKLKRIFFVKNRN